MASVAWREALSAPGLRKHTLLIHETPLFLQGIVAAWAADALTRGHGALLIGREATRQAVLRELRIMGVDAARLQTEGRLVGLDAGPTIDACITDGALDRPKILDGLRAAVASVASACRRPDAEVRIWGEMVDVLCCRGEAALARELEPIGNEVLRESRAQILCSYDKAHLPEWGEAVPPHSALIVESSADPSATAAQISRTIFREVPVADPMALLLGRGAVTIGGTPPRAFLVRMPEGRAR